MGKVAVGIDVSKDTLDVVAVQGDVSRHAGFKNNDAGHAQLQKWMIQYEASSIHVCLEATGQYGEPVATYLYQHNYAISVVNPVRIKAYGESRLRRNKTDKLDAALIADFCLQQNPPLWKPIPPNIRTLQSFMRRLEDLQGILQQERNRLQAGNLPPSVCQNLQEHIAYLKQRMKEIERQIQALVEEDDELSNIKRLLISISGIGQKTAHLLICEIPFLREFQHVNELVAFCGLNPRQRRSGSSINGKSRLSKIGSSRIRKGLYFPAIVAMKHNPILQVFADRLLKAGKPNLCVIGAVMRKLLHLVFGVLKSGQPFDPNYRHKVLSYP